MFGRLLSFNKVPSKYSDKLTNSHELYCCALSNSPAYN